MHYLTLLISVADRQTFIFIMFADFCVLFLVKLVCSNLCCIVGAILVCCGCWQYHCSSSFVTSCWLHCACFCVDFSNQQLHQGDCFSCLYHSYVIGCIIGYSPFA